MRERLIDENLRDVLARAEEIHLEGISDGRFSPDIEAIVRAAEEAGLPREAVEKAIQEKFNVHSEPPKVGQTVFARSSDGKYYVAEVIEAKADTVRVRFTRGGELDVLSAETRPANFLPGERIECPWPAWGWWTCTLISYDTEAKRIKVSDGWGSTETFSTADVRLVPPKSMKSAARSHIKARLTMFVLGLASGTLLGGLATWLITR